jgi:hypothetical protein
VQRGLSPDLCRGWRRSGARFEDFVRATHAGGGGNADWRGREEEWLAERLRQAGQTDEGSKVRGFAPGPYQGALPPRFASRPRSPARAEPLLGVHGGKAPRRVRSLHRRRPGVEL